MFTFIKKVIKTGTATSSYPLEPIAVDKNFRGKPCLLYTSSCPAREYPLRHDRNADRLLQSGWG